MTVQEALKIALRDVLGPCARSYGFKGTDPTWRKSTASGDWAVVNVQSSSFSSAEHLKCVINLAVAPEPWLRWSRVKLGPGMPKSVTESLGLYRERLHPHGAARAWMLGGRSLMLLPLRPQSRTWLPSWMSRAGQFSTGC